MYSDEVFLSAGVFFTSAVALLAGGFFAIAVALFLTGMHLGYIIGRWRYGRRRGANGRFQKRIR